MEAWYQEYTQSRKSKEKFKESYEQWKEELVKAGLSEDEIASLEQRLGDENPLTIEQLQEILREFLISEGALNLDETGIVPYLELKQL